MCSVLLLCMMLANKAENSMRLMPMQPRPDWNQLAEDADFQFHTMHGEP